MFIIRSCFYHLTQNIWRKIPELGLSQMYKNDKNIKLFCGMIDALGFQPGQDVKDGMNYLQSVCPEELQDLLTYFNSTYVSGNFRSIQIPGQIGEEQPPLRLRRVPPMFAPDIWNVHTVTIENGHRTNNSCEAWNHGFHEMLGMTIHQFGWLLKPFRRIKLWYRQHYFRRHKACHHRREGEWQLKIFKRG